jgi:inorganic phosphate transporter, PiT family
MTTIAAAAPLAASPHKTRLDAKLGKGPGKLGIAGFAAALAIGSIFVALQLFQDLAQVHNSTIFPFIFLGVALLIALGFEFVNGFHDTANAVATVIYTHTLEPHLAVVWSGCWNFIGVLVSSGAVAYGIISLLPVELILQVGSSSGFAMVFALLTAAIIWNLGTWYFGLPSSSSHTLIGSIIGVGLANQFISAGKTATSGVDWAQAANIGKSLLISPLVGFAGAALLLTLMKAFIPDKRLYEAPVGDKPPPPWIRGLLVLTCTGVSFAHGSNDGQKGMGLIMLILVGTVPTAYALNHAVPAKRSQDFIAVSHYAADTVGKYIIEDVPSVDARADLTEYVRTRTMSKTTLPALKKMIADIANDMAIFKELRFVPPEQTRNFRNDMYLVSETLRLMQKQHAVDLSVPDGDVLKNYKHHIDDATKFIPLWVKVAVAIALGLGTMVGWKRIVVTVGEKIGKDHLTYAQGAAAEITAMVTIGAADTFGLPVSTTHVLSSGVAGTMTANRSGLQWSTVRSLLMAWVLTLPVSILLSGSLFWLYSHLG